MLKKFAALCGGALLCLPFALTARAEYVGDFAPATTAICNYYTTYNPSTGAPFTLAGSPVISVYKTGDGTNSATESTTGVTHAEDFDSRTGYNRWCVDTSADGTFYSAGAQFAVAITTGTVNSVSVIGKIDSFSLNKVAALRPTTSGRTVVIDAAGLADANTVKLGPTGSGTAQTARDVGASVLLSPGTGTGQLSITTGVVSANSTQIGGQTASASGTITFPNATLASTTNITAGTIATVTNLTNAPTAGDFTATMKTSIGTAVAASAVASVTGNVGGNVTGSAGSVVGAVGSVTGNVGGNVVGSVASVTGNVGGNVVGSIGSFGAGAITEASFATTCGSFTPLGITRQCTAVAYTAGDPSVTLDASAPFANNDIIGHTVLVCGATNGYCESQTADAYSSSTKKITLHAALSTAPTGVLTFKLFGTPPGGGFITAADVWSSPTRLLTAGTNIALAKGTGITGFNDLSTSQVETTVWSAPFASYVAAGTMGLLQNRIPNAAPGANGGLPTVNASNQVAGVSGNVLGSVASVTGNVGGSVGSITGNVGGNVVGNINGSVGSLGTTAQTNAQAATKAALDAYTVGGEALQDLLCRIASVMYGQADYQSGGDLTIFKNPAGSSTRVTIAYGTDQGDRNTVTLGASCGP